MSDTIELMEVKPTAETLRLALAWAEFYEAHKKPETAESYQEAAIKGTEE